MDFDIYLGNGYYGGIIIGLQQCLMAYQHNTGHLMPLMVECWNDLY